MSDDEKNVVSVEFTQPPPMTRYDWQSVADELRQKPNEWARVFKDGPVSAVNSLRQGVAALPPEEFKFRTSNNDKTARPRTCDLWIMYTPRKKGKK